MLMASNLTILAAYTGDRVLLCQPKVECSSPQWATSQWSGCTTPCGEGTQTRHVGCQSEDRSHPEELCGIDNNPPTQQACNSSPCSAPAMWHVAAKGVCDTACGGSRNQTLACVTTKGLAVTAGEKAACGDRQPQAVVDCPPCLFCADEAQNLVRSRAFHNECPCSSYRYVAQQQHPWLVLVHLRKARPGCTPTSLAQGSTTLHTLCPPGLASLAGL